MQLSAFPRLRKRLPRPHIARSVLLALAACALAGGSARAQQRDTLSAVQGGVAMPNVVGRQMSEARAILGQFGILIASTGTEASDAPEGTVVRQSPGAGRRVQRGTRAALVISSGPQRQDASDPRQGGANVPGGVTRPPINRQEALARVPDVSGMSRVAASGALLLAGLRLGAVDSADAQARRGTVVAQQPAAGELVPRGTPVALTLASAQSGPRVPNLFGLTPNEAEMLLSTQGLALGAVDSAASERETGTIVSQRPAPDAEVRPGSRVAITLSRSALVQVPELAGLSVARAGAMLREAGLRMGTVSTAAGGGDPDVVLGQSVDAGARVTPGTAVGVTVAAGTVTVPNLAGRTVAEAAALLRQARLARGAVDSAAFAGRAAGTVARQSPAAGTEVAPGSVVALTLAQAPLVAVPDVVGDPPEEAQRALAAAGLRAGSVETVDRTEPGEAVVRQSIAAGTRVRPGTALDLRVARGPEAAVATTAATDTTPPATDSVPSPTVVVPDLAGRTLAEAQTILTTAGLSGEAGSAPADAADLRIASQSPAAGTAAAPGSVVRLTLQAPGGSAETTTSPQTTSTRTTETVPAGSDSTSDGGRFPWIWIVVALLAIAVGAAIVRAMRKSPPEPVPAAAPPPAPVPVIRTSGAWDPGAPAVAVEGRLLGEWEATLGGSVDAGVQTVEMEGTLVTAEEEG